MRGLFIATAVALSLSPALQAGPAAPAEKGRAVDVVLCLDTSNSMDGLINTIYCGPPSHPEAAGWKEFAGIAGGKYANIDQDRAGMVSIKTPFDDELTKLGAEINKTYCWYGDRGSAACANQLEQDKN